MPRKKASEETPVTAEAVAPVEEAPKKRGRKPKAVAEAEPAPVEEAPKKRGRKPKAVAEAEPAPVEEAPKKRGRKPKTIVEAEAAPAEEAPRKRTGKSAPKAGSDAAPAPKKRTRKAAAEAAVEEAPAPQLPKKRVAFIGSECYPFVKTGGLGDVMYALPKELIKLDCEVRVMIPRYKCIPAVYQDKMAYRGEFMMDLCADGRSFYVGIMEYVWDGVIYDFIDNEEFFSWGKPYTNLVDDIPKYCFFAKASLAVLNYLEWIPDVVHCHDWQAALVPVYLRTLFAGSPVGSAKSMMTIHNLRFQGWNSYDMLHYWSGLPDSVFGTDGMGMGDGGANMLKGGLSYADMITTVSETYAGEIQTAFYGENLDAHLRLHAGKLRGIVNGIDVNQWDSAADKRLAVNYDRDSFLEKKPEDKKALQAQLGLDVDERLFVLGLVSRLTDQKGLDLVNAILPNLIDGNTQLVVLGTGDAFYEDAFRRFESEHRGSVSAQLLYDEGLAHSIYAGCDAFLVPSLFEPCGLTQLIAMRYGTVPIVRETGGLKDTVAPYNQYTNEGNGFTFDRYEAGLLLDAVNRAKTLYFTDRWRWDEMVRRDMDKDVSWGASALQYRDLYYELKP